jgi:hypothetical protein
VECSGTHSASGRVIPGFSEYAVEDEDRDGIAAKSWKIGHVQIASSLKMTYNIIKLNW